MYSFIDCFHHKDKVMTAVALQLKFRYTYVFRGLRYVNSNFDTFVILRGVDNMKIKKNQFSLYDVDQIM